MRLSGISPGSVLQGLNGLGCTDMRLESESYSIDELIERIDDGRIALPEFQRDFKWKPAQIAELPSGERVSNQPQLFGSMERKDKRTTGLEPATSSLGSSRSTS